MAVAASRTSTRLYGLNSYALQLETAVAEALEVRQQAASGPQSPAQVMQNLYRHGQSPPPVNSSMPSFETIFRAAAIRLGTDVDAVGL